MLHHLATAILEILSVTAAVKVRYFIIVGGRPIEYFKPNMSDRKAELERKKLRLQQMRDEKKRKEEEKRRKEVGSIDFLCSPQTQTQSESTVPEVLLSSDGQCPQLVSDHLRLWRVHSGGICCSEGLISNSFHMSDKTYQNSRGCISWGGGEANIRLVPGNICICLLCLCAASGLM